MTDLDFSSLSSEPASAANEALAVSTIQPTAQNVLYQPMLALEFFKSAGVVEEWQRGKPFFTEGEKSAGLFAKSARMYLLLEGEVGLMLNDKFFGIVKMGEVFGELGVIADLPRSASAMAMSPCRVLALDRKQFLSALQKTPEFALMLMSIMVQRLRKNIAQLAAREGGLSKVALARGSVLDKKMLAQLADELGHPQPLVATAGQVIVSAGAVAALMYVVNMGQVAISVEGKVVEEVGAGGFFGELALLDNAPRAATVTAQTDCALLTMCRRDFLDLVVDKPEFSLAFLKSLALRMQQAAQSLTA